jgi:hypothetical protein
MAMISAGVVVSAATQATKQRWKACASSVAKISPDDHRGRAVAIGAEPAQELELLFAKEGNVGKRLSRRQHGEQAEPNRRQVASGRTMI